MKMYKIIPNERRITELDYDGTYNGMIDKLPYQWYDTCRVNAAGDYLWVNDTGLLDGTTEKDGMFHIWRGDHWQPISGMALYCGCDKEGENSEPSITLEQLENIIRWKEVKSMSSRA